MGTFGGLLSARESLVSHGAALASVADNLANSSTVGFKTSRPEFSDLFASGEGSLFGSPEATGNGTRVDSMSVMHSIQGALEITNRDLDFSVEGRGFFAVSNGTEQLYTRAGNFQTDDNGNIVNNAGYTLLGFTADSPDTPVALDIDTITGVAVASTTGSVAGNLDVTQPIVDAVPTPATFSELNAASAFSSPVTVIDSLGQEHDIALHFFHTGPLAWTAQAYVDGAEVGGVAGTPTLVGTADITVGPTGVQDPATPVVMNLAASWGNGADATAVALDVTNVTSFAANSAFTSVSMDGATPGNVTGYQLGGDGSLFANLDNGGTELIGTVALATFPSADGLERRGDTLFAETGKSGAVNLGNPGTEGRGTVRSGALESSTTDTANEFVSMIRYQRGYEAGSKVISTLNDVIRNTINLA